MRLEGGAGHPITDRARGAPGGRALPDGRARSLAAACLRVSSISPGSHRQRPVQARALWAQSPRLCTIGQNAALQQCRVPGLAAQQIAKNEAPP